MKYSYLWLKELSQTQKNPQQLANQLMMQGFELEEMENLEERWKNFKIGKVLKVEKHPNANRLKKTLVNVGDKTLNIVCGAPNVKEEMLVVVALVGAILPKDKIKIEKQKVRGEISEGMLCSEDELALGKDKTGIIDLGGDFKIGQSLAEALNLQDWILDLKVLPNRAHDCLSHQGMAREILVGEGKKAEDEEINVLEKKFKKEKNRDLVIEIKEKKLCPRYLGGIFTGIKVGPAPLWIKAKLIACGMEPINNVVDITNLVMLEVGNPLHAFDKNKLEGKKIIVRKGNKREKLELLGNKFLVLEDQDLVIADEKKVLALAGIKGGKHSGIDLETSTIVLEAAVFDLFSIRKTRQRHALTTESQLRFEKGLSPFLAEKAFLRAKELLEKYADAVFVGWAEEKFSEFNLKKVIFEPLKMEKLLGEKIDLKEAIKILENLGFKVDKANKDKEKFELEVPYWRMDIEGQEDLAEEIGRITGYEKISLQPLSFISGSSKENKSRQLEWKMKDCLVGLGFDEALGYSFYGEKDIVTGKINSVHWELANYISPEQKFFRQTLLASLFSFVAVNRRNFDQFNLFEMGRTFWKEPGDKNLEKIKVAGVLFDRNKKEKELFYFAKGLLESFLKNFVKEEAVFSFLEDLEKDFSGIGFFQKVGATKIDLKGKTIGFLGIANEATGKHYGFKEKIVAFELDFEILKKLIEEEIRIFSPLEKFPSVKRDLSMFTSLKKEVANVKKIISLAGGKKLKKVELFDVFENKKENKKSLAFHLIFSHSERTLESGEVDFLMEKICKALQENEIEARTK